MKLLWNFNEIAKSSYFLRNTIETIANLLENGLPTVMLTQQSQSSKIEKKQRRQHHVPGNYVYFDGDRNRFIEWCGWIVYNSKKKKKKRIYIFRTVHYLFSKMYDLSRMEKEEEQKKQHGLKSNCIYRQTVRKIKMEQKQMEEFMCCDCCQCLHTGGVWDDRGQSKRIKERTKHTEYDCRNHLGISIENSNDSLYFFFFYFCSQLENT